MQRFTLKIISISIKFFISNVYEYHNHEIKRVYRLQKVKHVRMDLHYYPMIKSK